MRKCDLDFAKCHIVDTLFYVDVLVDNRLLLYSMLHLSRFNFKMNTGTSLETAEELSIQLSRKVHDFTFYLLCFTFENITRVYR